MGRNKLKVYSSKVVTLSDEEKNELYKRIQNEVRKYENDSKCGGVSDGHFIRLHSRYG